MISQFCFCIAVCDTLTQNMSCERFFIISTLSKAIENFRLHFLKNFLQTKIFFLTHLLYAKSTFNSDRRLYKKKWCDLMRTWLFSFHWNLDCTFWNLSYRQRNFFLTRSVCAKSTLNSDRELYKKRWCDQMRTWFSSHWRKKRFTI